MPPLTSSLLSRSSAAGPRVTAAAAAAISKPASTSAASAAAEAGTSPSPSAPAAHPRQQRASPFASGLAGRLFGGHRAAARSSSSAAAVFERRFASAATKNAYDEILTSLAKPGGGADFGKYYSLPALADPRIDRLPYSIRILLESAIRNCDEFQVTGKDVEKILDWENNSTKQVEIPFKPARVLLQDFTGVPAVVDLACMRDAMSKLGSDPNKINPLVPVDLVGAGFHFQSMVTFVALDLFPMHGTSVPLDLSPL